MIIKAISYFLLFLGAFFIFTATVGSMRMSSFYTRIHALGVSDSLGVPLFLLGLIFKTDFSLISIKLCILVLLGMVISPLASYILTKAEYKSKLQHMEEEENV